MWNKLFRSFLHSIPAVLLLTAGVSLAAEADQHAKVVDGVAIYLGVMPSEIVREHPKGHPESAMHDGAPANPRFQHVVIALFDAKTGKRITDAKVKASVGELGLSAVEKTLEPMAIAGAASYGNYFPMGGSGPYRITVEIRRPGVAHPIKAEFDYRHAGG